MSEQTIRPGCGFWDITHYPIGGKFTRNGETPLVVTDIKEFHPKQNGANRVGNTKDNRRIAFFHEILTTEGETS